jgi:thymidylate synthase (FAD)
MGSDLSVVNAARISFAKEVTELGERDEKLIHYLWTHRHTSPFRHATVQIHLKAPLFVLRQWMKHQIGCAWNEVSGRYVRFEAECYHPETWRLQHESNKQGSRGAVEDQDQASALYQESIELSIQRYEQLLAAGVCREQARMLLPLSLYSECYWTASLQAIMHFLELREDSHSQWETQHYARAVRALCAPHFPICLSLGREGEV